MQSFRFQDASRCIPILVDAKCKTWKLHICNSKFEISIDSLFISEYRRRKILIIDLRDFYVTFSSWRIFMFIDHSIMVIRLFLNWHDAIICVWLAGESELFIKEFVIAFLLYWNAEKEICCDGVKFIKRSRSNYDGASKIMKSFRATN